MRDIRTGGTSDISRKWSIFFFHSGVPAPFPRHLLRVLFLSDVCCGARCNYFIAHDHHLFFGYVLHGAKCLIGRLRHH